MAHDLAFITNFLIDNSRDGLSFDEIKRLYFKNDKNPVSPVEVKGVEDFFEKAKLAFPNYEFLRSVLELEFIQDIATAKYYLIDANTRTSESIKIESVENAFNKKTFDRIKKTRLNTAVIGWNPDTTDFKYKEGLVNSINLYRPADWQLDYFLKGKPVPETKMPDVYDQYLKHLTRNKLSYDYCLAFMAATVQNKFKPKNYCVLMGRQGLGKGVFFDIISALVGTWNAGKIKAVNLADKKFNKEAKHKKILFFDEFRINGPTDEDALKDYVNETIEVEEKGVDSKIYKNYSSTLIATNDIGDLKISADDRRFCLVDTGPESLAEFAKKLKMPIEKYVAEVLLDPENIANLGRFLLNFKYNTSLLTEMLESETRASLKQETAADWVTCVLSQICPENAGKKLLLTEVQEKLTEATNSKIRPGRRQWAKLAIDNPGFFKLRVISNDKGVSHQYIEFADKSTMPKYLKDS